MCVSVYVYTRPPTKKTHYHQLLLSNQSTGVKEVFQIDRIHIEYIQLVDYRVLMEHKINSLTHTVDFGSEGGFVCFWYSRGKKRILFILKADKH